MTLTDQQFHEALQKAMQLDRQLQPALNAIYRHLNNVLMSDHDRSLFQLYVILQSGANLSLYAPRYLLSMEMTLGDYLEIYTEWARKAEDLLKALEPVQTSNTRRKHAKKVTRKALERKK